MKILKLEIKHVRGIPDLSIKPGGRSLVIYGANGSGKSAVIDAIDFLLTGKIARLSGEGTDGVSLKEHGPHIDKVSDLTNVEVSAEIKAPGIEEAVVITRKMSKPNELLYDQEYQARLEPVLELLNRGQHVFTRREILKLVTAKSSIRAQEIQKVLKLSDLEAIRSNLVSICNESRKEHKIAKEALDKGKQNVIAITGQSVYDQTDVLNFINEQRKKLGVNEINALQAVSLKEGIKGVQINPASVNHKSLTERLESLQNAEILKLCGGLALVNSTLRTTIIDIKEDVQSSWNFKRSDFTKDGLKLIRDTGECPLCDNEWPFGELSQYLQKRVDAESARQTKLSECANKITEKAIQVRTRILQAIEVVRPVAKTEQAKASEAFSRGIKYFENWASSLSDLIDALQKPMELYIVERFTDADVVNLYNVNENNAKLEEFEEVVKTLFPEATPEQTAWDNLTRLVERIKIIEESEEGFKKALIIFNRATELSKAYVSSRDEVLENLYDKIKERFVGLYKEMHGDDEKDFDAFFTPQEAGLNFDVDFYGRGLHPPHAMHSEGHQDSMGVCLFMALSEHLNSGLIDLTILDDVVMSVDIGHRRAFCSVLVKNFLNKQFIITTHDTFWANQLRGEGLVNRKQMLKFSDWRVETGPSVHYEADMWTRIEEDLAKDDISAASAKLRNGLEEYTRFVCHNLRAKVPYTLEDAGNLGDFLPAAIGTFKDLLGKAKASANSWNRHNVIEELNSKSEFAKDVISRALGEQWTINTTVHFNDWAKLSKEDFLPVVKAFRELCDSVFACDNQGCESVLKVTYDAYTMNGVRCKCGANNWNLIKK
jgi:recombinational DNA repair ATPase RecF